jgi:hypothetical protein
MIKKIKSIAIWCKKIFNKKSNIQNNDIEKIQCAAIWYQELKLIRTDIAHYLIYPKNVHCGLVFYGFRHPHCMYSMVAITGLRSCEVGNHIQGFLTNKNQFVDRKEGLRIALEAGQVLDISNIRGNNLYSEDIY